MGVSGLLEKGEVMGEVLENVLLSKIRENPSALREVKRDSEKYAELVDSIKTKGILNPPLGRKCVDPETGEEFIGLIDGLQRFNAAKDAGLEDIPMLIKDMDEGQVLEAQLATNLHKIETRPAEYAKQLNRLLSLDPFLTISTLADRLSVSTAWLHERLGLVKLNEQVAGLVDNGDICVSNANYLARLPESEQMNFLDRAQTDTPQKFIPEVQARLAEIRAAKREGRDAKPEEFAPVPRLRRLADIKDELMSKTTGKHICNVNSLSTAEEGFAMAINWVLQMDPETIEVEKAKWEQRKAEQEEKKRKRAAEREAKKAEAAAAKSEEAKAKAAEAGVPVQ